MEPVSVTIPEACRLIGVKRSSLYKLMDENKLESVKIAGRRLVKVSSIRRLIEEAA